MVAVIPGLVFCRTTGRPHAVHGETECASCRGARTSADRRERIAGLIAGLRADADPRIRAVAEVLEFLRGIGG